ncbi:MAG: hypothetical protein KA369_15390 [Spirochaetes bacterium]|nr:hypothetical protein [Spirochaetota bacterium]
MKIRIAMVAGMCLLLTRCATYYHMFDFTVPRSNFYTEQEKEILEKTTKSIEFDYGYNPNLDLDYVFPVTKGYTEFKAGDKDLSRALDGVDSTTLIAYSEKVYRLRKMTAMRMEKYRTSGQWDNYTLISKYLMPSLDFYSGMVEKQAMKRDRDYMNNIEKKRKDLDRKTKQEMYRKEFDEIWKNDYNS